MTSPPRAGAPRTPPASLEVELVGPQIDDDVWDRLVAVWRLSPERAHAAAQVSEVELARLRRELTDRRVRVRLQMIGPRLQAFTVVTSN